MRAIWVAGLILIAAAGRASAQSLIEGPWPKPADGVETAGAAKSIDTAKHHHKPTRTAHHAAPKAGAGDYVIDKPAATRASSDESREGSPVDPLSFGMKWNGNNDSARDTRVQNYSGSAAGSGAEVGLKLHF